MAKTNTGTKTMKKTNKFREHLERAMLVTCDIWDTGYISDSWELEFMSIFVTWQLRVTLDSIRNSCDVYLLISSLSLWKPSSMWGPKFGFKFNLALLEITPTIAIHLNKGQSGRVAVYLVLNIKLKCKCISKIKNCKIVKLELHRVAQLKKYAPLSSCEKFQTIENKTDEICNTHYWHFHNWW